MPSLADFPGIFTDTLMGHAILTVYLFVILDSRGLEQVKRLPVLLLSPLVISVFYVVRSACLPQATTVYHLLDSGIILLICTLWVRWAWRCRFWRAFAAVCTAGIFQVAVSTLTMMLFRALVPSEVVFCVGIILTLASAALLRRLRFGFWFRLLLEDEAGLHWIALLLFAMMAVMGAFLRMQKGIQPDYLILYYPLEIVMAAMNVGLIMYLAKRFETARVVAAQRDIIAQQILYERDLEAIRRETYAFRHDYKNLLAGLSQQAGQGELEAVQATLAELGAGFDRRIGEKIQASIQTGNLRIPQVRSVLLSKLAAMGEKGVDWRLEVLYPVERVNMDVWDFVRCLGILIDNAAEAALETEEPWVEIVLLAREETLSLTVSNPYRGTVEPDKMWQEGWSTKGPGRGLGLAGYLRILSGYPGAVCSTNWAEGVFVQDLIIGGRP